MNSKKKVTILLKKYSEIIESKIKKMYFKFYLSQFTIQKDFKNMRRTTKNCSKKLSCTLNKLIYKSKLNSKTI